VRICFATTDVDACNEAIVPGQKTGRIEFARVGNEHRGDSSRNGIDPVILWPSGDSTLSAKSTRFIAALRPFSLVVAVATCGLGIALANADDGSGAPRGEWLALAILVAGVLLQVGVNLINDYPDLKRLGFGAHERAAVVRNARIGVAAIVLGCMVGLWIVSLRGWPLLALGGAGVFGLWAYAAEPMNLKSRGLGLPAVFLLTGVWMVAGSYYAMRGMLTLDVIFWSLPLGLFAMLLLLANELRDFAVDAQVGLRTFTVRFGYEVASRLYLALGVSIACVTAGLAFAYAMPMAAVSVLALALLPFRAVLAAPADRRFLARSTGRAYTLYALILVPSIWIAYP
jgi:1,4-dihydroxy-2-naphthoate octaprenyltransferase